MASTFDASIPLNTLLHMITVKLNSTNYLLWKNQMNPILTYQNLFSHVDGSLPCPPCTITVGEKEVVNPEFSSWDSADQRCIIILQASLTEEAITVIVGLSTARLIWVALEKAYGNSSIERVHNLRDQLRLIQKGTKTVAEFGRAFKALGDQLAGLSSRWMKMINCTGFCAASVPFLRPSPLPFLPADLPRPSPTYLLGLKATSYSSGLFITPPHPPSPSVLISNHPCLLLDLVGVVDLIVVVTLVGLAVVVATGVVDAVSIVSYVAPTDIMPTHVPILRHSLPGLKKTDNDLASAFLSQCHVSSSTPDWFVDSGATDHMTSTTQSVFDASSTIGSSLQTGSGQRKM